VIEAAGAPQTFEQALRMARPLGRVVMMGNPAGDVRLPQATVSHFSAAAPGARHLNSASCGAAERVGSVIDMLAAGRLHLTRPSPTRPCQKASPLRMMHDQSEFFNRVVIVNEAE
jgi:threonine dehydrogenase-like Zn-dependent dehydrogenase